MRAAPGRAPGAARASTSASRSTCRRASCSTRELPDAGRRELLARWRRAGRRARARDHRDADHGRPARARCRSLARLHELGVDALDRRLRHRLLVAGLPQAAAGRRAQDRPLLRARAWPATTRDAAIVRSHDRPGPQPRPARRRRGRRDAATIVRPPGRARLRRRPGLLHLSRALPAAEFAAWVTRATVRSVGAQVIALTRLTGRAAQARRRRSSVRHPAGRRGRPRAAARRRSRRSPAAR